MRPTIFPAGSTLNQIATLRTTRGPFLDCTPSPRSLRPEPVRQSFLVHSRWPGCLPSTQSQNGGQSPNDMHVFEHTPWRQMFDAQSLSARQPLPVRLPSRASFHVPLGPSWGLHDELHASVSSRQQLLKQLRVLTTVPSSHLHGIDGQSSALLQVCAQVAAGSGSGVGAVNASSGMLGVTGVGPGDGTGVGDGVLAASFAAVWVEDDFSQPARTIATAIMILSIRRAT